MQNKHNREQDDKISFQKAYNSKKCEQSIEKALSEMVGFDFQYQVEKYLHGKRKLMHRNGIYLRFNCIRCKNKGRQRRFTSTLGTISIWFQLIKLKDSELRDPWKIVFNLRIYRMNCLKCGRYGYAEIYDSQLEMIQQQFCQIIGNILNKVPKQKAKRNANPITIPNLHNHRHKECQACRFKKCHKGRCPS